MLTENYLGIDPYQNLVPFKTGKCYLVKIKKINIPFIGIVYFEFRRKVKRKSFYFLADIRRTKISRCCKMVYTHTPKS